MTIIPIAERGERPTARLTRDTRRRTPRRWIASLRRRDAKDSSFSPRASASETQKMKTARAAHPSIHPIPFSAPNGVRSRRTPFGELGRERAHPDGNPEARSGGRARGRQQQRKPAHPPDGPHLVSHGEDLAGSGRDRAIPQQSSKPTSRIDQDNSDSATD